MIKTHTFCGVKFDVDTEPCDGMCDNPYQRNARPTIYIPDDGTELNYLDTVIHESLHACNWHKSEVMVRQTAKDISRLLWRLGYRRRDNS